MVKTKNDIEWGRNRSLRFISRRRSSNIHKEIVEEINFWQICGYEGETCGICSLKREGQVHGGTQWRSRVLNRMAMKTGVIGIRQ
ncbi:hypothetical protein Bca4012_099359 [Brassica carinata]